MFRLSLLFSQCILLITLLFTAQGTTAEDAPPPEVRWVHFTRDKGYQYTRAPYSQSHTAHRLLGDLEGLEIGPSSCNAFGLNTIHVGLSRELDPLDFEQWSRSQLAECGAIAPIDVAANAEDLSMFSTSSVDYVIHSHMWEHIPNPLRGLLEWVRVIRDGGVLFAIVPVRNALASDIGRPVTTIHEMISFWEKNATLEDFPDAMTYRGHLTVFSLDLLLQIMLWFNRERHLFGESLSLLTAMEQDDKVGNGHLIAWRVNKHDTRHIDEIAMAC